MNISYEYIDEIDSTNDELKRRAARGECHDHEVLSAGMQTKGKGRSGHEWSSPKGSSVSTSMILFPREVPADIIPRITPIAAVAVSKTIEDLYGLEAGIKWPNDVLIKDKKVCGILTELTLSPDGGVDHVIVGIGVNVHIKEFDPAIAGMATSIDRELLRENLLIKSHCGQIISCIWESFLKLYTEFLEKRDLSTVLEYYNDHLVNKGRRVRVMDPIAPFEGEALFMDETGRLHIMTDEKEVQVDSGEVSVRGIYGYV